MRFRIFLSILILSCLFQNHAFATHIRAGEITAVRVSGISLTYRFTFTGFRDSSGGVQFGGGTINFGDGSGNFVLQEISLSHTKENLGNFVEKNVFIFEHTFPYAQDFIISYKELNRNEDILTMYNSVNTPFYIETKIVTDPFFGRNSTPILLVPPVDKAISGVTFIHNPGAYDADGDSLAYKLVNNKQDLDLSVYDFKYPNDASFYPGYFETGNQARDNRPTYTLNPYTGDLIWDAPGIQGEYNTAMIIEEWRKIDGEWYMLGYVTRDMQILVEESDNQPPQLFLPKDTCVVAGTLLDVEITADDPDGHDVKIEAFSGIFELPVSPATYTPNPPVFAPVIASMKVKWQTNGKHVRRNPYQVNFKSTDKPPFGTALADLQIWNITVVGPAPENLTANLLPDKSVAINWDPYKYRNDADKMQVWRRVDSYEFEPGNCETGVPQNVGYELVGEADILNASFNDSKGVNPGVKICYRLVAVWAEPGGGESLASEEVCIIMPAEVPLITHVSVENTSEDAGEILVNWTPPFDIDQELYPPPYQYEVLRAANTQNNLEWASVATISDTSFTDTGLNTSSLVYYYKIILYDANQLRVDTSAAASSVWLDATIHENAIRLDWNTDVPWSNFSGAHPYHLIYRNDGQGGSLTLIDSVNVLQAGATYFDQGQYNGQPLLRENRYCYFVVTSGSYGNPQVISPLFNKSQELCLSTSDSDPPCAPVLSLLIDGPDACSAFLADKSCNFNNFSNTLTWEDVTGNNCKEDIRSYKVYYSASGEEESFKVVSPPNLTSTTFIHNNLFSLAGCYRVTAVDRSGKESPFSETICIDNCPQYELPNVFTPNGDDVNDTFRPKDCPRFVESVNFRVLNRWGKEIYTFTSSGDISIYINWDGRGNDGTEVPAGVYYYVADVTFIRLKKEDGRKTFKGWVHVLK